MATDYGVDVDARDDVPVRWGLCSGLANLANALVRRLLYLRRAVNAGLTDDALAELKKSARDAIEADPRVLSLETFTFSMNTSTSTLTIDLIVNTADGPFPLVLAVTSVTVDILNNGVQTAAPAAAAVTVATPVPGPAGLPGVPGPSGAKGDKGDAGSGGGGGGFTFDDTVVSTSGTEELVGQLTVDFSAYSSGTLTVALSARFASSVGTATFKLYVGGTFGGIDGTLVGTLAMSSATLTPAKVVGTLANPTGLRPVKITITSSGAGASGTATEGTVVVSS